jgi:Fe-S cluster assembly iron-binding protein IscA
MLTLTPNAATVIRALVEASDLPHDAAGLRIANESDEATALSLSLAAVPAEDDQVVDESGARVFLAPQAAMLLDDKALDAATDGQGNLQFGITEPEA